MGYILAIEENEKAFATDEAVVIEIRK